MKEFDPDSFPLTVEHARDAMEPLYKAVGDFIECTPRFSAPIEGITLAPSSFVTSRKHYKNKDS